MVILPSGNVGIGTTAPAYKLDVAGSGRFTSNLTVSGTATVGNLKATGKLFIPSYNGNDVYDLYISNAPIAGEAPSGSSGIDEAELWSILTDNAGGERIAKAHLPLDTVYDADLTSALGGYALKSDLDSYYTKTDADERYVLLSSYTAADVLAKIKTVDGSGSGLDADLLDGQHGEWYQKNGLSFSYISADTGNAIDLNTDLQDGGIAHNYYGPSGWINAPDGMGYGSAIQLGSTCKYGSVKNALFGQFAWGINHNTENPTRHLWFRAANNLGFANDWHKIAFTDGNVASATKLQNARTLWGQPFDGTANVSGDMVNVGDITMLNDAEIRLVSLSNRKAVLSGGSLSFDYSGLTGGWTAETYVTTGDTSQVIAGAYGGSSTVNYLYYGGTNTSPRMVILPSGNVGIGTTAPAYKLDVAGTGRFTNDLTVGGYLYIGDSYLYNNTSVGLGFGVGGTTRLMLTDSELRFSNKQLALGSSSQRWSNVYSVMGNFSGAVSMGSTLSVSGTATVGNLKATGKLFIPSTSGNDVYDLYISNTPIAGTAPELAAEVETLKILSTATEAHLSFAATSYAYITSQGDFAFIPDGQSTSASRADLIVSNGYVRPGSTGVTYLGMASARWATLYCGSANLSATLYVSGNSTMAGDLTVSGEFSNPTSSSREVKDVIAPATTYSQRLAMMGTVIDFRYNGKISRDRSVHTGLIYESVRDIMPAMCLMQDGYGALNYLCPDYINTIAGAVQEHTDEIAALKKRIAELENEVKQLKAA